MRERERERETEREKEREVEGNSQAFVLSKWRCGVVKELEKVQVEWLGGRIRNSGWLVTFEMCVGNVRLVVVDGGV